MSAPTTRKAQQHAGFTVVEMLVSLAILGVVMGIFSQVMTRSLFASSLVTAQNDLISEGQIAQQLIANRLEGAYYIYPSGSSLKLSNSGVTTMKKLASAGASNTWVVGTDPFVALLVPPKANGICNQTTPANEDACFVFYAYYPILRDYLVTNAPASAPLADEKNKNDWLLMEYRAHIYDNVDRSSDRLASPPTPGSTFGNGYQGNAGAVLVDYVRPLQTTGAYTQMFNINAPQNWIEMKLRFERVVRTNTVVAPKSTNPLTLRVYPRNWN